MAARVDNERDCFRARLLAVILIGALRVGNDAWFAQERNDPAEAHAFTKKVFQTVWEELREFGRTATKKRA